jgi:hypothetical protein
MKGNHMVNREALEDAVYDLYPDLGMNDIERMETGKLQWLIDVREGKHIIPNLKTSKPAKPKTICEKIVSTYEIRNGELMHIEKWRTGQIIREYSQQPANRVSYESRMVSASLLKHYLLTGDWVKRVPKPRKPYKAQIRKGSKVIYLGSFVTVEERDAAIFAYKLGITM